jgi:diguanylate cyclase (GGDEF)-like protein
VVLALPRLPVPEHRFVTPWWLVAPLFSLSEFFVVHLRVRRSAFTVSFGHVPLVLGLGLLEPTGFLLASYLGSVLTLVLHRRQRGLKLLFNSGLWAFEAALAVTLYGVLASGAAPHSGRALLATLVTIVVTDQLTALAIAAVISVHEGRIDAETLHEAMTWGLLVAVSNTSVGLLGVVLLQTQPIAVVLLAVIVGVLAVAYRAYGQLGATHERLERHHDFAQVIARARGTAEIVSRILEGTCDLMEAERAELHLDDGTVHTSAGGDRPAAPTGFWAARAGDGPVHLTAGPADAEVAEVLRAAGASEAVAVRLPGDGKHGVLVALEPMGDVGSFTPDQVRAFQALANQAGVALENDALVNRLRTEAAEREHESLHDALTGLPNRRGFFRAVDAVLREGRPAGVLLLNIDRFKEVNDALGHAVGDDLLRTVAGRLRASLPAAVVGRLGADEFGVLLTGDDAAAAVVPAADRLAAALAASTPVRDVVLHVEVSIGSAAAPGDGTDVEELLQHADVAMSRAKETRSGHARFDPSSDRSSAERLELYARLRHAVDDGLLQIHLQPCVAPGDGRVVGAEALVRWPLPEGGFIPPDAFIPLAERSGLIRPLSVFVLETALQELGRLRARGLLGSVAVNMSTRMLDADLPGIVTALLRRTGTPAGALTLEVTETAMMTEPEKALSVLQALADVGVHLSIDDYGTGYSSLAYLKRLPVHEVKIDRSFVAGIETDAGDRAIVTSTIDLAHTLGLRVVAEGVEDPGSLERLAAWGCDAAQGYAIARPLPPAGLQAWLEARARQSPAAAPVTPPRPRRGGSARDGAGRG